MEPANVFLIFTDRLERTGICYMATGSVASMLYGIPRFTHDLDLIIELPGGDGMWVDPPEYVIIRKLEYYREGHSEKHLHDINGMLEISGDSIDQAIIHDWVERLDLQKQWSLVSASDFRTHSAC